MSPIGYATDDTHHAMFTCCVSSSRCGSEEPTYEALWADKSDFNEVLISPTMINDHMPDNVLDALEKVGLHHSDR